MPEIVLAIIIAFFLGWQIGHVDIQFWDEATNLGVMVESAQSNDWWNLKYNNDYFWEKPPLFYWIGIILYKIFTPDTYHFAVLVRALTAAFASLLLVGVYYYLNHFYSRRAALLGLIIPLTIPSLWFFNPQGIFATHNFRSADLDTMQIAFILWGFISSQLLMKNLADKKTLNKSAVMLIFAVGIFSGLAFMAKGVFGAIPIMAIFINNQSVGVSTRIKVAIASGVVLLLFILPWHLYMTAHFGKEFIEEYLIYHQLNRAGSALEGHNRSINFYLKYLFDPQTSGILAVFSAAFIFARVVNKVRISAFGEMILGTILLAALSLIQTKLAWYSLYPTIFFIIATAVYLGHISQGKYSRYLLIMMVLPIYFNLVTIINLPKNTYDREEYHINAKFLTTREFHRNFYYQYLQGDGEIITPETSVSGESYLVDRHELKKLRSEINYQTMNVKPLSDNYAVISYQ